MGYPILVDRVLWRVSMLFVTQPLTFVKMPSMKVEGMKPWLIHRVETDTWTHTGTHQFPKSGHLVTE